MRSLLILATLALSWLLMQAVHELGHVLHAQWSGVPVERVILHPLALSETVLTQDTSLFIAWAGALWGVAIPLSIWAILAKVWPQHAYLARFFAGFCLVANGVYLGVGAFARVGDAGDLLRHGAAPWQLLLFGLLTVPCGFWLWNGQGPKFGLGPNPEPVRRVTVWVLAASLLVLVVFLVVRAA